MSACSRQGSGGTGFLPGCRSRFYPLYFRIPPPLRPHAAKGWGWRCFS